jgi:preprotein translocase subunit SecE
MAVAAEARKMDNKDQVSGGPPNWVSGPLGWGPRKLTELKTFFVEVRSELKKVTWPSKNEVYSTTVVVILTTVFFGFYLYGLDILLSQLFTKVLGSR